jgi:hypothetical protein
MATPDEFLEERTIAVEVRIGVTQSPKEIEVDLGEDADPAAVAKSVEDALSGDLGVLWLTDRKGRRVGVPGAKVAYVEIGSPNEDRRVGFGSHSAGVR